jgi:aconitate hydratase
VLIAAGLVAKKADELGLKPKPWVKTSLAPGSQVVTDYLEKAGLQSHLDNIGFNLVGYGCTTCIGNSGPLAEPISKAINENGLVAASVLSGNRNFEGRVSPDVRANFLASPPLVVAYALKGTVIGPSPPPRSARQGRQGRLPQGHLADQAGFAGHGRRDGPRDVPGRYADVFKGDKHWQAIKVTGSAYSWRAGSTYVANPPYFEGMTMTPARCPTSSAPSRCRSWATRSPPTTSRRPARSRPTARRQVAAGAPGRQGGLQLYGSRRAT